MAYDQDDVLHVTDRQGRVVRLPDDDADGAADTSDVLLTGLNNPHGITFHQGSLYVAEEHRVIRVDDPDAAPDNVQVDVIIDELPEGSHWSRTIRFGPDGLLYLSIGSSCNVCEEVDQRRASIRRYNPDGSGGQPFASGLRNAVGIAFHPQTGELWATNNGRDLLGDDLPPETINLVREGDDFGWPRCHAGDIVDPVFGGPGACDGVAQPAVKMQAHSAPLGLTFHEGSEPSDPFTGDMFVAFHGSWNRSEPTGYKVVRIPFELGQPSGEVTDFVSGWLLPDGSYWGRPVDVITAPDGSLLISDDDGGRIFRVARAS
jgi:glucose/arabinose dehydrogenase